MDSKLLPDAASSGCIPDIQVQLSFAPIFQATSANHGQLVVDHGFPIRSGVAGVQSQQSSTSQLRTQSRKEVHTRTDTHNRGAPPLCRSMIQWKYVVSIFTHLKRMNVKHVFKYRSAPPLCRSMSLVGPVSPCTMTSPSRAVPPSPSACGRALSSACRQPALPCLAAMCNALSPREVCAYTSAPCTSRYATHSTCCGDLPTTEGARVPLHHMLQGNTHGSNAHPIQYLFKGVP